MQFAFFAELKGHNYKTFGFPVVIVGSLLIATEVIIIFLNGHSFVFKYYF